MEGEQRVRLGHWDMNGQQQLIDITSGKVKSFDDIATKEKKVERHIRLLAPLAFVAPSIAQSIIEGTAPVNLTVTELAKSSVHSWRRQEHLLKVSRKR
jgi:site-specific DNA recombinase